jgi:hypothetical protein
VQLQVDFCGEIYEVSADRPIVIGREGDIRIDDNPFLHRRFLEISATESLAWLSNVGNQLSATVSDHDGRLQAWLAPSARLPLVLNRTMVWFTAGPTTYEFEILIDEPAFTPIERNEPSDGATTVGRVVFTPDQHLLVLVLCEQMLKLGSRGTAQIPSSADAAGRLGWTLTRFNRKLDNVCDKLTRAGIRGLHGEAQKLASNRRSRLVEYALAARLVSVDDLVLLDGAAGMGSAPPSATDSSPRR